ncbi:MAG: sulfite exporter TauE/SafE family protein [Halieaceae bacterium]|jgi:uncharacterized membrane protein YfcA|nr:sulfite exporter TauE/SafE family protein [Halieaceae bacterium]
MTGIAGFELSQLLLVSAVVVLAALLRGFTGFGFALVAVPVFALIMPPTEAVVLSALLTLTISLGGIRSYWGVVPVKPMWPLVLMALVGTVVGTWVITMISASVFQFWAGLSVILACAGMACFRPLKRPLHPGFAWLTGLLSGLMNGALAIPGPPMIIYAMLQEPQPHRSRALLMTFFLAASLLALASFAVAGFFSWRSAGYFLASLPALYAGDRIGSYLFHHFGSALYRRIALAGLLAMGASIVIRALL